MCSADWKLMVQLWAKEGYAAAFERYDTKAYYIPHTRTRGYLLAIDATATAAAGVPPPRGGRAGGDLA